MGGRGSESNMGGSKKTVAFDVFYGKENGGGKSEFIIKNGKVREANRDEYGDSIKLTKEQIIKNAKKAGYEVKEYNAKEYKEKLETRVKDRAETDKQLNTLDAQMGGNRSEQRRVTRGRRGSRRGI